MYLLSNMAILDIYVRFQGVEKSWLFSWDPFHYHLLFQSSAIWVSHPMKFWDSKFPPLLPFQSWKTPVKATGTWRWENFPQTLLLSVLSTWLQRAGIFHKSNKKWLSGGLVLILMRIASTTPLKTNMSPKNGTISIGNTSSNHWFSGDMLVFRGVDGWNPPQQPWFSNPKRKGFTPWPPSSLGNS